MYRVQHRGRTYTAYNPAEKSRRWLAFNPGRSRFSEVSSSLLVRMNDFDGLEALIDRAGALRGKAYPALGWALLRLPARINPADAARRLAADPLVSGAELLLRDGLPVLPTGARRASVAVATARPARAGDESKGAKGVQAPDLFAYLGAARIAADALTTEALVYNLGAVKSAETEIRASVVDGTESTLWAEIHPVPELDPGSIVSFEVTIPLDDTFAPGQHYYTFLEVRAPVAERFGVYSNSHSRGFSLDDEGRVIVRCGQPVAGGGSAPDPLADEQWHLNNTGQRAFAYYPGVPGEDLRMSGALDGGPTGKGVQIAVVDTGLEICHPDLAANVEPGASYNFNAGEWLGSASDEPFLYVTMGDHGTSVAGVAAAVADNGLGGRGVAPDARLRGYNLLEAFDLETAWVDSLGGSTDDPDSGDVDIFNMSFGSLEADSKPRPELDVALFRNGIANLRGGRGAIYVKGAGNGYRDCGSMPRHVNWHVGCNPANNDPVNNLPYLIVVGGFSGLGGRASYSSAGSNLWISAPAGEFGINFPAIITTDQMGWHRGYDKSVGAGLSMDALTNPDGHFVSIFNGTSSATPNAAGAIALLLEAHPELTWRDVKHILASTARQIDPLQPAVSYGLGSAAYLLEEPWTQTGPERLRNWYEFGATPYTLRLGWVTNAAGYHYHNWYGFGALAGGRCPGIREFPHARQPGRIRGNRRLRAQRPCRHPGLRQCRTDANTRSRGPARGGEHRVGDPGDRHHPPLHERSRHSPDLTVGHREHPQPGVQRQVGRKRGSRLAAAQQCVLRRGAQRRVDTQGRRCGGRGCRHPEHLAPAVCPRRPPVTVGSGFIDGTRCVDCLPQRATGTKRTAPRPKRLEAVRQRTPRCALPRP